MVIDDKIYKKHNSDIFTVIDILLDIILNKDFIIDNTSFYNNKSSRDNFIVALYILKLLLNDKDYINKKAINYENKIIDKLRNKNQLISLDISKISNIKAKDELDLLYILKDKLLDNKYIYKRNEKKIYFEDNTYVDIKWLLSYISLLLDEKDKNNIKRDICICYVIPNRDIDKCYKLSDLDNYFKNYNFYKINIKHTDTSEILKDKEILMLKNATNKYLLHLKNYRNGLESEEAYQIFYNLVKNECHKKGLILEEEIRVLNEVDSNYLNKIKSYIKGSFLEYSSVKQPKIIDSIIWKISNSEYILEQVNNYIDNLVNLLSIINIKEEGNTYNKIKENNSLNDIKIVLILIVLKFVLTYLYEEELDYSKLDLSNIKPEYMSVVDSKREESIKEELRSVINSLQDQIEELDKYKFERQSITKENLGDKYRNELEMCISNINRVSIDVSNKEKIIEGLNSELEELRENKKNRYDNLELYEKNYSIIKHMVNAFVTSGFCLKTNNNNDILDNIVIVEDYVNTDNSFYLEIGFKDLMNLCKSSKIDDILPRLK